MNENILDTFEHNCATVHKNIEESQIVQQLIDKDNKPSLKTCFNECGTHFHNLEATTPRKPNHNTLDVDTITSIGRFNSIKFELGNLTPQGTIGSEQLLFLVDTGAAITAMATFTN